MDTTLIDQTSETFLGQWSRLVSTTNWEKGRIIWQWREALAQSDAPVSEYSDDAWSRRVGNITPQHVGRLRRAWERFGAVRDDYDGLYWSHFQAALDWVDAEMWLEGAVQNHWSVAQMRSQRATTLGLLDEPLEGNAASDSDWDQDAADAAGGPAGDVMKEVRSPVSATEESESFSASDDDSSDDDLSVDEMTDGAELEPVRPFANLPSLPPDVSEAFETYKLCILRHKLGGWTEISRADLLASLDSLKELALAP